MTTTPPPEGTPDPRKVTERAALAEAERRYPKGDPHGAQTAFIAGALWHYARGGDFRPSPPAPTAEDDAVRRGVIDALGALLADSHDHPDLGDLADAALDAAGVPALRGLANRADPDGDRAHEGRITPAEVRAALAGDTTEAGAEGRQVIVCTPCGTCGRDQRFGWCLHPTPDAREDRDDVLGLVLGDLNPQSDEERDYIADVVSRVLAVVRSEPGQVSAEQAREGCSYIAHGGRCVKTEGHTDFHHVPFSFEPDFRAVADTTEGGA